MPSVQHPGALAAIMAEAFDEMKHSLAKSKAALSHNLSKGEAAEESVRTFFRNHLPSSLGVAKGQVIDCQGERSKQIDIIIYDSFSHANTLHKRGRWTPTRPFRRGSRCHRDQELC